ncbi:hypothetical protein [Flavobacterium sp.]|uniref:hypothetical protein n=1 Tax=Flavobacterium sp. TaxID=239 RepID=UPI00261D5424|nr:hypothetical protein [Flavobacterium sp.]
MILIVAKYLIPKGYSGLAAFPFVLVKKAGYKENLIFINHEKIHLRQQLELLIVPFFIWYGLEFLIRWCYYQDKNVAYRNLSFEREAYANESNLEYLETRKYFSFLNYLQTKRN